LALFCGYVQGKEIKAYLIEMVLFGQVISAKFSHLPSQVIEHGCRISMQ
jgi:hypothetical protein